VVALLSKGVYSRSAIESVEVPRYFSHFALKKGVIPEALGVREQEVAA
jgi:hypothetical protein